MTARIKGALMPFREDMNLGRAYNEQMDRIGPDEWALFLDHDAMWTTKKWKAQIEEAIAFMPGAGLFAATSNRIGPLWQRRGKASSHQMEHHYALGEERLTWRTLLDVTDTQGFGGVAFAISKAAWEKVGGFVDGMLCVDHAMHFALRAAGYRVYVLESLYVYHRRRAFGAELPEDTPVAANCPCRAPETAPTERIALP